MRPEVTREDDLLYTADHEWVEIEDGVATVGITAFAANQLGDIVYVELPAVGDTMQSGDTSGEIESTKSVGELFAPVAGEVIAVNEAVVASPELVNEDPLGDGWLIKVRIDGEPEGLLDRAAYDAVTAAA